MTLPSPVKAPFHTAVAQFQSGTDSPRAFLERCLAAVDRFEPQVGAFVCMDVAAARAAADAASARWKSGSPLSRIDGMPVGIKDIIETAQFPTQMGSPLFDGWHSHRDAASVAALRQAGAVVLGKTVTTEFAATHPRGTRNPWDLARTPGGSSSGSAAAVASGMVSAALGTQVIGSILRPASFCGVFGFKPTIGAINRGGSHDGLSQSAHGPLAASLQDAWIVAREIADRVGGDPGFPGLFGGHAVPAARKPRRLALLETTGWSAGSATAKAALESAIAVLTAQGVEVVRRGGHARLEQLETALLRVMDVSRDINAWESLWPLIPYRATDASKLSAAMTERLLEAEKMTLADYRGWLAERTQMQAAHAALAGDCDACITLSAPGEAPLGLASTGNPVFNVPASLLCVPAITLPLLQSNNLPLGLQVIGYQHADEDLFGIAAWLMQALASVR